MQTLTTHSPLVHSRALGHILLIEIDNPPINAGSAGVREGLLRAIEQLRADASLHAAVLMGAGTAFMAGSDLKEFGQPLAEPQLPQVIAAIEACEKPVVAALHGAALGGGLELALGCDARVAVANTQLGLPEVTLGMIPGAGGTQRLPRLVGMPRAIEMVGTGERITARQAQAIGLVDAVVESVDDLLQTAIERASHLGGKRRVREMAVPTVDPQVLQATKTAVLKAGKGRPQVQAAIDATCMAMTEPVEQALLREREVFQQLRIAPDAFALRHQFFAEREAVRLPSALRAPLRQLQTVVVIGAGTMGVGIAIALLQAGLQVLLLEQDQSALARGSERLAEYYRDRLARQKISPAQAAEQQACLQTSLDWQVLAQADLVIEAVYEDLAVKQAVFQKIDAHARAGAILASNTSYLDVDAIAGVTKRPEDVLGLHFFSPAHVMRLLEVVRGEHTAADVLATAMALGKRLGKVPVLTGNAFGFIGNRIYNAYRQQCEFLLEEGAWPEEVDAAMTGMGMAMGPFAVADLSGLDIAWRMRQAQAAQRDPRQRYVPILDWLCESGRMGQKTGAGYYQYSAGKKTAGSDAQVRALIERASAQRGLVRAPIAAEQIVQRVLVAMVHEAACLLEEGVAHRASDIDVVLVQGYGFPRWLGGPVFWAQQQEPARLQQWMDDLVRNQGFGAQRASAQAVVHLLQTDVAASA
ncbi:3-hydroxyacyl-CoA dehydrogenase [Lampropedia puyangensis]|uniref:3-hydroxyacyl-CoA dehydrogenase n=1 Tax=Lampropedia puyangensis TaxID=1330072 RepID=A0A4S8EV50_9BURK|nr:FAD-dependent oxidoreductase [Lampropedia puyangensis]THT96301.1 3-hydroxyacyl-CoA dehydrogenase [Lampropedia puyangensis]